MGQKNNVAEHCEHVFNNKYIHVNAMHELPGVVRVHLSGQVDLRTAQEQEDDNADDEPGCREDNQPDGADRCQLESRHDEPSTETTEGAGQRPRHR